MVEADDIISKPDKTVGSSPVMRKKMQSPKDPDQPVAIIQENDDLAELSSRRKSMVDRRKSMNLNNVIQMPENQMEEKLKLCIQLSNEKKINMNNAFKCEIIDILTCMVNRDSSTLQVATSTLDVSSKIYGLRVDKLHVDVIKIIDSVVKKRANEDDDENAENNENDEANETQTEQKQKKKRKKKRLSVLSEKEVLRGNVEVTTISSLLANNQDSLTSDMLFQTTLPHTVTTIYYMMNTIPAIDHLEDPAKDFKEIKFHDVRVKLAEVEKNHICSSFNNFYFRKWKMDEEKTSDEEVEENDEDHNRSIFQFDLDASVPADVPFGEDEMGQENAADPVTFISKNIATGIALKVSEYSYVPSQEIIRWAGPSHWKIKISNKNTTHSNIVGACGNAKQPVKRKILELEFNDETVEEAKKMLKVSRSTQLTTKTMKTWMEDKLISDDVSGSFDARLLFKFKLRPSSNVKIVQTNDMNTTQLNDDNENIYDYNNALDTSEYCPNVDLDNDDMFDAADENDFEMGKFAGNNLVEMPDLVDDNIIPYSRKAKKIDVGQLKKSIWKTINNKEDEEDVSKEKAKKKEKIEKSFSYVYNELPKLLSKNNLEAMSVPVCFVSLLHLANEKSLLLQPNQDLSNLNIILN